MRTTQFFGLSAQANQWLAKYAKHETLITCPCCGVKKGGKLISYPMVEMVDNSYWEEYYGFQESVDIPKELFKPINKYSITGMFEEEVHVLRKYELKKGGYVEEYIQAEPWSSGVCIFLALKFSNGEIVKKSLWDEETINNC